MGKPKVEINAGDKWGKLTILKEIESHRYPNGSMDRQFLCKCECGKEIIRRRSYLTSVKEPSCGCYAGYHQITHNQSYSRLYSIWKAMRRRCQNPNADTYRNYGARGITVCEEWSNHFESFYEWAMLNGYFEDLEIDRIDVNGNYEPSNCRWATDKEQSINKRNSRNLTINGVTKHISEWSKETGVPIITIWKRFKRYGSSELLFVKNMVRSTEEHKQEIIELFTNGVNRFQISQRLRITPTAITNSLKRWRLI